MQYVYKEFTIEIEEYCWRLFVTSAVGYNKLLLERIQRSPSGESTYEIDGRKLIVNASMHAVFEVERSQDGRKRSSVDSPSVAASVDLVAVVWVAGSVPG